MTWGRVSYQQFLMFCWTIPLRHGVTVYKTSKYDQTEPVFVLQEADWLLPSALLWCVHRAPPQWTSRVWRWPGKSHTQSVRIVNTEGLSLKAKTHRSLVSGSQSEPSVPVPISQTHCVTESLRVTEDNYTESGADKTCCARGWDKNGWTRCHISINTHSTARRHTEAELRLRFFLVHKLEFEFNWNLLAWCWNWFTELQV